MAGSAFLADPAIANADIGANGDGFPLDPEDVDGAKGTGPTGEDERDEDPFADQDADEFQREYEFGVAAAITAAEFYIDNEISPDREEAAKFYMAEPFGNEETGRSAVVSPEVRQAVLSHMTGLMRMFAGTERYVEFKCNAGTPQEQADFQTDYIEHVINSDNNGYIEIQSAVDNALRRKTGIFTWWWEEKEIVTQSAFSGLGENELALLQMEARDKSDSDEQIFYEVRVNDKVLDETQEGGDLVPEQFSAMSPEEQEGMAQAGMAPPVTYIYAGVVMKRVIRKRARFRSVPPEEFIISPTSSSVLDTYALIGTREEKSLGEMIALGHDEEELRNALGLTDSAGTGGTNPSSLSMNSDRQFRDNGAAMERIFDTGFGEIDEVSTKYKYCVVYIMVDKDGDGIIERRKVVTVGDDNKIVYDEVYDDDAVPFAVGCPYPEPHAPFGQSVADHAMDIQEVKSELIRGTLDSLAESITSRLAFWQGKVNVDDILNPRRGAAIRTNDVPSNVIQNLAAPFVGANSLPLIQYVDEEATKRSGKNAASPTGFDPDSTQSTAREAIGSMIDASQERTEYIARNLAETLFRPLFIGLRNLILRNQDHRRVIRLNGQDVATDPRTWVAGLDVRVLVGTGRTNTTKKIAYLEKIQAMQIMTLEKLGPGNPIVTWKHVGNLNHDLIRAYGFDDSSRYMGVVTPEVEQKLDEQAAKAAAKPSPEMLLAQIQDKKNTQDFIAKMLKLRGDQNAVLLKDDASRDKADQDFALGVAEMLGKFGIAIDEAEVRRQMEADRQSSQMAGDAIADSAAAIPPGGGKPEATA